MNTKHLHMLHRARAEAKRLLTSSQSPHAGYVSPQSITIGQKPDQQKHMPLDADARHLEARRKYPQLGLSAGEYVILQAHRHPIGLVSIWFAVLMVLALSFVVLPVYASHRDDWVSALGSAGHILPSAAWVSVPLFIASGLFLIGGLLASKVYLGNTFFLTNESIIQQVQKSIFDTKNQTINLVNVEDVSYDKRGLLQHLFDYGDLRLSTQGEETTYHFYTVGKPHVLAQAVNDATEAAMHEIEKPQIITGA